MAWGRSQPKAPPPPRSALSKLAPLLIFLIVILVAAFVAYHIYLSMQKISTAASDKMQSKNVVFTKDGVKVGVKEVKTDDYVDKTQSFMVKAWNLSTWPEYKSRLWNKDRPTEGGNGGNAAARKPYSRTSSSNN